jgi:chromosome segregation ATPase
MDVRNLKNEAVKLRQAAESKRKEASAKTLNATQYSKSGDFNRAQAEQDQTIQLEQTAQSLEEQAMGYEREVSTLAQQVAEIEKQKAAAQADFKQKMNQLETQKCKLLGETPKLI